MKKIAFTIAAVAAFSFANAQEQVQQPTQTPTKKTTETTTPVKKEGANTKGTAGTEQLNATPGTKEKGSNTAVEPKKSSTRMAINEKGLPGEKKPAKSTKSNTPK